jgi:signal transduction histidine kinase
LATASWLRRHSIELGWGAFAAVNLAVMPFAGEWETVPFHFIWVSLTLLYGFRVWRPGPTTAVLAAVCVITGGLLLVMSGDGQVATAETTEVPLMSAMFVAMVWHARRRQAALEEVRRAAERERDFVRDASHQLRTPITIARGHAELIRAECAGQQQAADADVVIDELARLTRISERLLLLAAIEHPDFHRPAPVDLAALLCETGRRWSASAERNWIVEADPGLLQADGERLTYALDALIENAVKFTCETDTIAVTATRDGDSAVVEVRDTGPGIPPEQAERVFERFARVGDGSGGTGLGLPIVKAIAEAHGGTVEVAAPKDDGLIVRMRLPRFRAMPALRPSAFERSAEVVRQR